MAKKTKADALKTRQHLIETAIVQFALRGVSNTTLNDIADAARVTRGAIYWHFENKTQLFNEVWAQQPALRELIQDKLLVHDAESPLEQLREQLIVGLQYIAEIPRQQALLQILFHKCEFNEEMISEQKSMAKREIANQLDLDVMVIVIYGAFSGIVKNWLINPTGYNLYQQAPVLVDNVLRMLMPDPNKTSYIHDVNISLA
ncbi:acrEF/envCD operon transcriptional regulator [Escherichia fergusonii]|uniref:acrEF/envCD operon transcriptional regulator n=1 Tax=Escherichia fergusonii TaxID=564 RepID=UPI00223093AD|nr:acrEF/envCD operon transcriptional regulator [Escherichia fergusonii]